MIGDTKTTTYNTDKVKGYLQKNYNNGIKCKAMNNLIRSDENNKGIIFYFYRISYTRPMGLQELRSNP